MGEYRLDSLGWFQFERLCQTLLSVPHGLAIETWGGSKDLGRDAYAPGPLRFPDPAVPQDGPFVFQAKFVEDAAALGEKAVTRLKGTVKTEATKLAEAITDDDVDVGEPAHYVLMTNVRVGASTKKDVVAELVKALPDTTVHLVDERGLETMITGSPAVRLSFPQILSLRDLSGLIEDVVNRDLANRAEVLLRQAEELAQVFAPTQAHFRAIDVLVKHHFAVLAGPPEMGKTAIAKMVALAQASVGWDVVSCRGSADFDRAFEASRRQVFIADDAFGSTEYRPNAAQDWEAALPEVIARLDKDHWLIWTSRSEPLRRGLDAIDLRDRAAEFPDPAKVLVRADRLTVQEKSVMLYRHAKAAGLPQQGREIVRQCAARIVNHDHFTPLRCSRFVRDRLPALLDLPEDERDLDVAIAQELSEPTEHMKKSFGALDDDQKKLLVSLLDVSGDLTETAVSEAFGRFAGPDVNVTAVDVADSVDEHFISRS